MLQLWAQVQTGIPGLALTCLCFDTLKENRTHTITVAAQFFLGSTWNYWIYWIYFVLPRCCIHSYTIHTPLIHFLVLYGESLIYELPTIFLDLTGTIGSIGTISDFRDIMKGIPFIIGDPEGVIVLPPSGSLGSICVCVIFYFYLYRRFFRVPFPCQVCACTVVHFVH